MLLTWTKHEGKGEVEAEEEEEKRALCRAWADRVHGFNVDSCLCLRDFKGTTEKDHILT